MTETLKKELEKLDEAGIRELRYAMATALRVRSILKRGYISEEELKKRLGIKTKIDMKRIQQGTYLYDLQFISILDTIEIEEQHQMK